jgi:hypothetical protein
MVKQHAFGSEKGAGLRFVKKRELAHDIQNNRYVARK